jgi:hypothetical protein
MQWQHGSYEKMADSSLILKPIKVDGRQLYSDPCQYKNAVYTRYNATERFKVPCSQVPSTSPPLTPRPQKYQVSMDAYHKIQRLDLYQADGAPLMPLYLAYSPPKMLPTTTLNPLVTATAKAGKTKRGDLPMNHEILFKRSTGKVRADQWWWFGVFMTAGGGVMYWFF